MNFGGIEGGESGSSVETGKGSAVTTIVQADKYFAGAE